MKNLSEMTKEEKIAWLLEGVEKPKPEPPKVIVVSTQELSVEAMQERATKAAREALEREEAAARVREAKRRAVERGRIEAEEASRVRQAKLDAFAAAHWHATEAKWHDQQANRFANEYRGFHSRND